MPTDLTFDLRAARARDEINDALGMRGQRMGQTPPQGPGMMQQIMQHMNVQANPQQQQVAANIPLGGGLSAGVNAMRMQAPQGQPQMGPQVTNVGLNYQRPNGFSAGVSYNPMQRAVGANMRVPFAHGGAVRGYAGGGAALSDADDGPPIIVEGRRLYDSNRLMDAGGFGGFDSYGYGGFPSYGGFDLGSMRSGDMVIGGGAGSPTAEQPKAQLPQVDIPLPQPQMPAPTPFLPRGLSVGNVGMPIAGPGFDTHGTGKGFTFRSGFEEGGLATSLRPDPQHHAEDLALVETRNRHLREMAGKQNYARGALAVAEGGAWTRKEGQNPEGGLNAKGRASLKAQGHDIKPPVSAKLAAKSPKAAARRKSFCARMGGMEGPMEDENGKPTRKALALRKWDCKAQGGAVEKLVWDKKRPADLGEPDPLSAKRKKAAKARAKAAGRPYPNLVDNMAAARSKGK